MKFSNRRSLGRSGIDVSPVGMGCWAIGGRATRDGKADGWGDIDDSQSIRSIHLALELGVNLLDSADAYGAGHSENIVGRALTGRRGDAVIATKFGFTYDEDDRTLLGTDVTPSYIDKALSASLRRLRTDYIDLYQIHPGALDDATADAAGAALEQHSQSGKIRAWGWSTGNAACASRMLKFPHFSALQQELNIFQSESDSLAMCEKENIASLCRSPLAMGMLTGKFSAATRLPRDDVRGAGHNWVRFFKDGRPLPQAIQKVEAVRELLKSDGRTVAQSALGWILARSPKTLPIPGFKTEDQVRDNLGVLQKGPLSAEVMEEIDAIIASQA